MKPIDLAIADYVYFNCFDGSKIIVKITAINNNGLVYGVSEYGSHWCNIDKVEPIPFAPEILEKNEFETTPSSWEIEINNIAIVIVKKQDDYLLSISEPYCDGIAKGYHWVFHDLTINHVHQLQHSLRLCGLNDKADNFKLEE